MGAIERMGLMVTTSTDVRVPTVVLYDIMCEAATRVGGALVALEDKDPGAHDYLAAHMDLADQISAVDVDDRVEILATTEALRSQLERLHEV